MGNHGAPIVEMDEEFWKRLEVQGDVFLAPGFRVTSRSSWLDLLAWYLNKAFDINDGKSAQLRNFLGIL